MNIYICVCVFVWGGDNLWCLSLSLPCLRQGLFAVLFLCVCQASMSTNF